VKARSKIDIARSLLKAISIISCRMESTFETAVANKVQLLIKKVQDRKTAEIFEDTISYDEVVEILEVSDVQRPQRPHETTDIVINIVATMKSIAHTTQSKSRWELFCKERQDRGDEVFTISSKGDFTNFGEVDLRITKPTFPRSFVMCTLKMRMEQLVAFAKAFEERKDEFRRRRVFHFYFDEFDKYIDSMREYINQLVQMEVVKQITLVTATPKKIWSNSPGWERLYVLNPRIESNTETYLMFKECSHIPTDNISVEIPERPWLLDEEGEDIIEGRENRALIDHHHKVALTHPNLFNPGRVLFVPGNTSRKSHDYVCRFWNHLGCSVAIINGERTTDGFYGRLYLPDKSVIDIPHMSYEDFKSDRMKDYVRDVINPSSLTSKAQLNEIIADLYHTYNLRATPFGITGRLCVERAQTLVHPVWGTFTDAIYFRATSPDDGYQQQRQLGHIKMWDTYRGIPRVFAPEQFRLDVLRLEGRSDTFAKRLSNHYATVQDYINAGDGELTSLEERDDKRNKRNAVREQIVEYETPFNTLTDVKTFLRRVLKRTVPLHEFNKFGGYEISTRLTTINKKRMESLEPDDRLTKEKYDRISKSLNISTTDKGQTYMVYPVYPTMLSRPEDVQYYVCYLPPPENTVHMPVTDDYSAMTRPQLLAICKERGLKGHTGKKKEELLALL
jgi:hypothetical protein